jgi:hypothetical protein
VAYVQQDPSSALSKELHGPSWSVEAQLIALAADHLAMGNWQRAGRKSAPKPKRIPRPWEKPKTTALGKGAIPVSQFKDWWDAKANERKGRRRRRQQTKKPPTD